MKRQDHKGQSLVEFAIMLPLFTLNQDVLDTGQIRSTTMKSQRFVHDRGQSLVEFALVAPLFFILVMGIFDFGRLFFTQMTLQHALRQAGRYAVTGNHLPDPSNPGQTLARVASIMAVAEKAAVGLDVTKIKISSNMGGVGSAGGPGDTMTISLGSDLQLITPIIGQFFNGGVYHFTVSTSFKNEPFHKSSTN